MYYTARHYGFEEYTERSILKAFLLSLLILPLLAIPAFGPPAVDSQGQIPTSPAAQFMSVTIKVKNFGQMDESFYRGAQPKPTDYKDLKALGIKTIIDLRDDPSNYEKTDAEALGMRYVNIPMSDKEKPKNEQIAAFFT